VSYDQYRMMINRKVKDNQRGDKNGGGIKMITRNQLQNDDQQERERSDEQSAW
jgi:hypothetical protein